MEKVKTVVRHKNFRGRTMDCDVAILTLDQSVRFTKNIQVVLSCLFLTCLLYLFVSFEPSLVHFLFLHIYHQSNCDVAILTLDQSVQFTKKHTGWFLTDVEFVKCFTRARFPFFSASKSYLNKTT